MAHQPPAAMVLTKLLLYNARKLSCKFQLFWASGSSSEDFRNIFPILNTYETVSPIMASPNPRGAMVPVRIRVRIGLPRPHACRKRRLNGAVLRMRPEKPRSRVAVGVAR
jgi:hypothetical protein